MPRARRRLLPGFGHRLGFGISRLGSESPGGNVQQANGNQIRFREVDQDGNPAEPATVTHHQELDGRGAGRTPFNPFIVVLWILAASLVAGGIWVFLNAASMLGPSAGTMALSFALINYAPWAVLSGTLAAMTLLFWHAAQWQRGRP